jgi:Flp pilus assembly protein TadD
VMASISPTLDAGTEADITAAIERGYDDGQLYYARGNARLQHDNPTAAETDFAAAIERGDDSGLVYEQRGRARLAQDNSPGAVADFTAAIKRGRDDAEVYYLRGRGLYLQDKFVEAEQDFTTAIGHGEDRPLEYAMRGYAMRGLTRFMLGNQTGAREDLTTAIEGGLDNAYPYQVRGWVRSFEGDYVGAVTDYTTAIERGIDDAEVYADRAIANAFLGFSEPARKDCIRVEQRDPRGTRANEVRGTVHLVLREYEDAIAVFRSACEAKEGGHESCFDLALALLLAGHLDEAVATYNEVGTKASADEIEGALSNFDFWTVHQADRLGSAAAKKVVTTIRRRLDNVSGGLMT